MELRRACAAATVVALLLIAALVAAPGPARAQSGGEWETLLVPGPSDFVVPDGVYFLTVDAQGGHGGTGRYTGQGGQGSGVRTTIPVTPGEHLEVWQGGYGGGDGGPGWGGQGGDGGSADGLINPCHDGWGGGGSSAVLRGSTPLVVAGGGGGGGGDCPNLGGGLGGDGGHPAQPGRDANEAEPPRDGTGGCASCASGTGGAGGSDATYDENGGGGGGGGAGYPHGGGGGWDGVISWKTTGVGGGGGAGGDSYADPGGLATHYYTGTVGTDGQVILSWGGAPATISPVSGSGQHAMIGTPFPTGLRVKLTTTDGVPVTGDTVRFTVPANGPSGTFAGGRTEVTAVTGRDGVAAAPPLTANAIAGDWSVIASASATVKTHFALANQTAPTSTALGSSADPSLSGQAVTFTATVQAGAGPDRPTGAVQFLADGTPTGDPVTLGTDGSAQTVLDTLAPGDHTVTARYLGDPGHDASSAQLDQHVAKAPSAMTLRSSLNPSGSGDAVTFSAHIAIPPPAAGAATGAVQFQIDGADVGAPVDLDTNGTATSPAITSLALGQHVVTATYAGDARVLPSDGSLVQSVGPEATAVEVASTVNPAAFGQAVTLSATVRRQDPGIRPTGDVVFRVDDRQVCGPVELVDATASCPLVAALAPGVHTVVVGYDGHGDYDNGVGQLTQQVLPASTATTISADPDPSSVGVAVRLQATVATVAPGAGTPDGTVRFFVDGAAVGDGVALVDGTASSAPIASLGRGAHVIEADYRDDAAVTRFTTSHGAGILAVNPATTTTTLSSDADLARAGQAVVFDARVSIPGATLAPTGLVQFLVDGQALGAPVALAGGGARSQPQALAAGAHEILAQYHGGDDFRPSDATLQQLVSAGGGGSGASGGSAGGGPFGEASAGDPAGDAGGPLTNVPVPRAQITSRETRVDDHGTLHVSVRCAGAPGQRCVGRLDLRTARPVPARIVRPRSHGAARLVTLATRAVSLPAGPAHELAVDLTRAGERVVSASDTVPAMARIAPDTGSLGDERRVQLDAAHAPALRAGGPALMRHGRVRLRVVCAAGRGDRCRGDVVLRAHGRALARGRVSVAGQRTTPVAVRITRAGRALMAGRTRLRARARAVSRIPVGHTTTRTRTVAVRAS